MEKVNNVLVVKVGTNVLVKEGSKEREELDFQSFARIGKQLVDISGIGIKPVLVSSAGITAGMIRAEVYQRPDRNSSMPELQRLACIGWGQLLRLWDIYTNNLTIGGLLLTRRELHPSLRECEEALATIDAMLHHGDLPVINENDAITHEEIAFGDNDLLAATLTRQMQRSGRFGSMLGLVMLSNVDGLYVEKDNPSTLISVVQDISSAYRLADDTESKNARGGMHSKLKAAGYMCWNGLNMWIANGRAENAIQRAMNGQIGTHFVAKANVNVE